MGSVSRLNIPPIIDGNPFGCETRWELCKAPRIGAGPGDAIDWREPGLTIAPVELFFGAFDQAIESLDPQKVTVQNTSDHFINIEGVSIADGGEYFSLVDNAFPNVLQAGESFDVWVKPNTGLNIGQWIGVLAIDTNEDRLPYGVGLSARIITGGFTGGVDDPTVQQIYDDFTAMVQEEAWARATADSAEAGHRLSLEADLGGQLNARILQEQVARVTAFEAEATTREALEASLRGDIDAKILTEQNARVTQFAAEALARTTLEASVRDDYTAQITAEQLVRADGLASLALDIQTIEASFSAGLNETNTLITNETQARADAISAEVSRVNDMVAELTRDGGTIDTKVSAGILSEATARTTAIDAEASRVDGIFANYATQGSVDSQVSAAINEEQIARASAVGALVGRIETLEATVTGDGSGTIDTFARAAIEDEAEARAAADFAEATARTTLQATLRDEFAKGNNRALPSTFDADGSQWIRLYHGDPNAVPLTDATFPVVAGVGKVMQRPSIVADNSDTAHRACLTLSPGRKYRAKARVRVIAGGPYNFHLSPLAIDETLTYKTWSPQITAVAIADGWKTLTVEYDGDVAVAAGGTRLRTLLRLSQAGNAGTYQVQFITLEDVTEEKSLSASVTAEQQARIGGDNAEALARTTLASTLRRESLTQYNADFKYGLEGWSSQYNVDAPFPAGIQTTAGFDSLDCLYVPSGTYCEVYSRRPIPVDPKKKYRLRARFGCSHASNVGGQSKIYIGYVGLDANGNKVDHSLNYGIYRYPVISGETFGLMNDFITREVIITGSGNDSQLKFPPGTVQIELLALLNFGGVNGLNVYLDQIELQEITDLEDVKASVTTEANTRANAISAEATARKTLVAQMTSSAASALNANSMFSDWPDGQVLPNGWGRWAGLDPVRVPGVTSPYAFESNVAAGGDRGIFCDSMNVFLGYNNPGMSGARPGWYVLEADVTLLSGTFPGSGILLYAYNSGTTWLQQATLDFATDRDVNDTAPGNGTVNKTYRFKKLVQLTDAQIDNLRIYAMTGWSGLAATTAKSLRWHRASVRPATEAEIKAQKADAAINGAGGLSARLTTAESTLVDRLTGTASAYLKQTALAGNNRAQIMLWANSNSGAGVDIIGDVKISGNLLVTGTVQSPSLDLSTFEKKGTVNTGTINIAPIANQTLVAAQIALGTVQANGSFNFQYVIGVQSNVGRVTTNNYNGTGKPLYTDFIPGGGGVTIEAVDGAGTSLAGTGFDDSGNMGTLISSGATFRNIVLNTAYIGGNISSSPVSATARVRVTRGNLDTGVVDMGDYYQRQISASYIVTSVSLQAKWTYL